MSMMVSQITSLTIVYSAIYSGGDQRKHQSSVLLAFVTGEFPAQRASNTENVSIWWCHHVNHEFTSAVVYYVYTTIETTMDEWLHPI